MQKQETTYLHKGKEYKLIITRKKMRSIRYYFKDGVFKISAPKSLVTQKQIMAGLEKYADELIKLDARSAASGDDFIYLLGDKYNLTFPGTLEFNNGNVLKFKDKEQLERKLRRWFHGYVTIRNMMYEEKMKINKPYNVRVRRMTTRYGSNAKGTHSVTYSLILMHYSPEIIDSVVVHELAHHFVRDHSQKFYNVVYKYCPDYKELHKKLRKGEFNVQRDLQQGQ